MNHADIFEITQKYNNVVKKQEFCGQLLKINIVDHF